MGGQGFKISKGEFTRIPQLKVKQVMKRKLSVAKSMGLYL
jgi:hypothetical protein